MPNDNKTLSDHLRHARSQRNEDKLKVHAAAISSLGVAARQNNLKPCTCGNADKTNWREHKSICPVYNRGKRQKGTESK